MVEICPKKVFVDNWMLVDMDNMSFDILGYPDTCTFEARAHFY